MKIDENSIGPEKTLTGSGGKAVGFTLAPGDTLGQYRIIRSLGRGGMGEVYEVEHATLERRYALKLLPADYASQAGALERFRREAKVMANLDHPNILKVDDFGENDGRYWLRMELAEGTGAGCQRSEVGGQRSEVGGQRSEVGGQRSEVGDQSSCVSLEDLVKACGGKVPQELVFSVVRQVLAGLQYAHGRGAVHRDLKPSNILFSGDTAKIADFGLVRLVGEEWVRSRAQLSVQRSVSISDLRTLGGSDGSAQGSSTRSMLGTFEYMSPEQKRGEDATAQSDLYAVGLMAYRLLTGRGLSMKTPSQINASLDRGWDELIGKALEEDATDRWRNAQEMCSALPRATSLLHQDGQQDDGDEIADHVSRNNVWYLKIEDGMAFGPVGIETLQAWAATGRIAPGHLISQDKTNWVPAESNRALKMHWMVELEDGSLYGPLHLDAVKDLLQDGTVRLSARLINCRTRKEYLVRDYIQGSMDSDHPSSFSIQTADRSLT